MTLISKVNRWGQVIFILTIRDIRNLINVEMNTKIKFVSRLQPETRKVKLKCVRPWFSRSYNEEKKNYLHWIPWPQNLLMQDIREKFIQEGKNAGPGWYQVTRPLGVFS